MAKLTLFSARACPFAHRTRLVLAQKNVAFELVEVDLQNKPARFSEVSGYGKVPAIEHDGVRLWESAVVNEYIDEVFPAQPLLPAGPALRAAARIWIDWANTRFAPAFGALLRAPTAGEQATAGKELAGHLGHFEREGLGKFEGAGPFFFGAAPSLVDFALYPWIERWPALQHFRTTPSLAEHPRAERWTRELAALASVRSQASPASLYIERYARYAAPPPAASVQN